ncbi:ribonuclease HI [Aliikangiella maris]|uniref:RNase H family protein n=2 Tax=Aliikangiella maris TaxID=3162458 RepID=A0ABV2BX75_9GAMM
MKSTLPKLYIFTDGSVNNQSNIGVGVYWVTTNLNVSIAEVSDHIKYQIFSQTSSTQLELECLLWALGELQHQYQLSQYELWVYTDSQNIIQLPQRREKLQQNDFYSSKNKRLKNYQVYQYFYQVIDQYSVQFFKVKGHQATQKKDKVDLLFSRVDKAARKIMRSLKKCDK